MKKRHLTQFLLFLKTTKSTLESKRRTGTNVGLVQTSDKYKRRTSTNVGQVQTSDGYIYKEKRRTLVEFERKDPCYKN